MLPVSQELRSKLKWYINAKPIKKTTWVCMSYMGRKHVKHLSTSNYIFADLTVICPSHIFIQIYQEYYKKIIEEEKSDTSYEWGITEVWDKIRQLNYPSLKQLLIEHQELIEALIIEDDTSISELIDMEPPSYCVDTYSLSYLYKLEMSNNKIILFGKVFYK
ncbi:MAG: Unknown protein [uncultured Sulfurovum sp.]|uniref:Uncharacterized protein n=1 Tax=uncultured Sulfurovum sp. TaxID=269237 RepID=A0A6S6SXA9_9BACT|nr:MAG: Unknown protein [uncultured Sulfurovum sp.]